MSARLRKGDTVQVISGSDKGKTGTIVRVLLPSTSTSLLSTLQLGPTGDAILTWSGGQPPFTVESREGATEGSWTPIASGLNDRSFPITPSAQSGFFRVVGSP